MENDGVGDVEVNVNCLSDNELVHKLRQLGANIGPVTGLCQDFFALLFLFFFLLVMVTSCNV